MSPKSQAAVYFIEAVGAERMLIPAKCRTLPRYFVEMEARVMQDELVLFTGHQTKAPCTDQVATTPA